LKALKQRKVKKLLLVVLDQFRYDYASYLKKCRNYISSIKLCDANSIPTMTESMHTNISTGKYPGKHEIISDSYYDERKKPSLIPFPSMYQNLISLIDSGEINFLSRLAYEKGYLVWCVGGKPKTAQLLTQLEACNVRVLRDVATNKAGVQSIHRRFKKPLEKVIDKQNLREYRAKKLDDPRLDLWVANLAQVVINNVLKDASPWLGIIAFPALDYIGHTYGPASRECITAIKQLDKILFNIFSNPDLNDAFIIITGDHGCRTIKTAIIMDEEKDPKKFIVYKRYADMFVVEDEIPIGSLIRKALSHIILDGGMIRFWLQEMNSIARLVEWLDSAKGLGKYLAKICSSLEKSDLQIIEHSRHRNFGEIFALAEEDVAFFRREWFRASRWKITQGEPLVAGEEMPLGEHGSIWEEDRYVPLILSQKIPERKSYENIDIFNICMKLIA